MDIYKNIPLKDIKFSQMIYQSTYDDNTKCCYIVFIGVEKILFGIPIKMKKLYFVKDQYNFSNFTLTYNKKEWKIYGEFKVTDLDYLKNESKNKLKSYIKSFYPPKIIDTYLLDVINI